MKNIIIIFLVAVSCTNLTAQVTGEVNVLDRDVFSLQYIPPNIISNDFTYQKWSAKFGLPPIRKNKLSIFNTIGLDVHKFNYSNDIDTNLWSSSKEINSFYNINYSLFLNYKFSKKWSLNALAAPHIISNFENKFSGDDFKFNGNLFTEYTYIRKKGGYYQFGLGVGLITFNGKTQISPIVHIKSRLNKSWSFVLGFPNANIKWDINNKHSIKALLDINDFSANLNSDKAVFTIVSNGLEYNYWIKTSIGFMLRVTQSVWSNYEIRDNKDNPLFNFDTAYKQPFIQVGIKFNPIRSLQNSLNPL